MAHRLDAFFSPLATNPASPRRYTDIEIEHVARLLEGVNKSWSTVPRTYIVLRTVGQLQLLDDLLALGFSDFHFPVQAKSLPQKLPSETRNAVVNTQTIIQTKSIDLEKENGQHLVFSKDEPLPFEILGRLGSGGYGQVDLIRSTVSFRQYALKRLRRRTVFGPDTTRDIQAFAREMKIIKALQHEHIVRFIGSYTDRKYLGILMAPVADTDLKRYLDNELQEQEMRDLCSFFGCLASAVEYLHSRRFRHRDIKPQNILIKQGNILLTDFGLSKDYSEQTGSTTFGPTAMTQRYCAPEVAAEGERNSASDIWSLGCVFLEMLGALNGFSWSATRNFLKENGTSRVEYHRNSDAIASFVQRLFTSGLHDKPLSVVEAMLQLDRKQRPSAAKVLRDLVTPFDDEASPTDYCGICCSGDQGFESDSSDESVPLINDATSQPVRFATDFSFVAEHSTIPRCQSAITKIFATEANGIDHSLHHPKSLRVQGLSLANFGNRNLIHLPLAAMRKFHLHQDDYASISANNGKNHTVLIAVKDGSDGIHAGIHYWDRQNLQVDVGDNIIVESAVSPLDVEQMTVMPIAETVEDLTCSIDQLIARHFTVHMPRALHNHNIFDVPTGEGKPAEFLITSLGGLSYGFITRKTKIHCESETMSRLAVIVHLRQAAWTSAPS